MPDRDVPAEVSYRSQSRNPAIGAITLAGSVGIELMLLAFLRWGPLPTPTNLDRYTAHIAPLIAPERDLKIFAAGIGLTLGLIAASILIRRRWLPAAESRRKTVADISLALLGAAGFFALLPCVAPIDANDQRKIARFAPLLMAMVPSLLTTCLAVTPAANLIVGWLFPFALPIGFGLSTALLCVQFSANGLAGVLAFLVVGIWTFRCQRHAHFYGKHIPWRSLAATTSAATVVSLAIFYCIGGGTTVAWYSQWRWCVPAMSVGLLWCVDLQRAARSRNEQFEITSLVSLMFATFAVVCLYVPRQLWPGLAGSFYRRDQLHHWNYFAFGPALSYSHGAALGSAVYSQYGIGWPLLFGSLHRMLPLTYANMIGVSAAIGCGYFVLLFIFLQLLLRNIGWAMSGTILAITLQIFSGTWPGILLWNYPSSTLLRHPLDVCCFLALLAFLRRRNFGLFIIATAIAGVAIAFELDTGIQLAAATGFFWLLHVARRWRLSRRQSLDSNLRRYAMMTAVGGIVVATGSWLLLLALAARGHLFHRQFWTGYFEGMHIQVFSGLSLLPIANVPLETLIPFGVICLLYVISIAWGSWQTVVTHGSATRPIFVATVSVYGLGIMLLFIGRSHPLNLLHVTIPLGIVAAIGGALLSQNRDRTAASSGIGSCLALCLIVLLLSKPEFEEYPNLLHANANFSRRPTALRTNPPDLAGFKNADREMLKSFEQTAKVMHELRVSDRQVLVLDERDMLLDYLANRSPWSRYTSLFHGLLTWEQVHELQSRIRLDRPTYLVMRHEETLRSDFIDLWLAMRPTVAKYYKMSRAVGDFDLWIAKKTK